MNGIRRIEVPTLLLLALTYGLWALGTTLASAAWLPLGMALVGLAAVQHSSLCHEALHGHPTRVQRLNELLVFPQLSLLIPYARFRDLHLMHHIDENLTDPYDDPETNYKDPAVWKRMPAFARIACRANNTLLGRMVLGPVISQMCFMRADLALIKAGDSKVLAAWLWHIPAVGLVIWWMLAVANMPLWAFFTATYAAHGVLKIRTYLEHRAHEHAAGRTVIVEDRGLLALLFLNNNFHALHHKMPGLPWYRLPQHYEAQRAELLEQNGGYFYRSYKDVFRQYFLRAKDPVPHPLWSKD